MEDQAPSIPEEISELLEQRSTFRDWLEKLENRVGDVRQDVYERVRSDYVERLASVEEELAGHREGLEGSLAECRERVGSLEDEREQQAAALEEAELRHAVGEYSDEEWDGLRDERQGALAELEGRLQEARSAARRFEDVLDQIGQAEEAPFEGQDASPAAAEEAPAPDDEAGARELPGPEEPSPGFTGEVEAGVEGAPLAGPALVEDDEEAFESEREPAEESREFEAEAREVEEEPDETGADDVLAFLGETAGGTPPEGPVRRPEESAEGPSGHGAPEDEERRSDGEPGGGGSDEAGADGDGAGDEEFEDELDFLESLSLDDASSLDTLSLVLDEGEEEEGGGDDDEEDRGGAT